MCAYILGHTFFAHTFWAIHNGPYILALTYWPLHTGPYILDHTYWAIQVVQCMLCKIYLAEHARHYVHYIQEQYMHTNSYMAHHVPILSAPLWGRLLSLPTRLEKLPGTNTLARFKNSQISTIKSFETLCKDTYS
jgi:hypothetical protein